ncbi:MAG: DinB family protein [Acidobacteriota bacterium]
MNRYSTILLVVVLAAVALVAFAQNPAPPAATPQAAPANPLSAEAKQMYNGVKNNLIKMAEKMPEEHYSFKATPEVRTFGQLVGHVADSQARTCSTVNGEAKQVNAGTKTTKADLVAALKESFGMCDKAFDALTDAKAVEMIQMGQRQSTRLTTLLRTVSHSNLEYGYMAVYMRLKGVVPPSSEGR